MDCLYTLHQHVPVQLILRLVCLAMRDAYYDPEEWAAQPTLAHPFRPEAIDFAAASGHIEVLALARERGCWGGEFTQNACAHAASWGQLETLKWLRAHGCEWDEKTRDEAV